MRKTLSLLLVCMVAGIINTAAQEVVNETLKYDVLFKWGIIQKKMGEVDLDTQLDALDDMFSSELVGRSTTALAEKFYSVRDTLSGRMIKSTIEPVYYEKIAHEAGAFRRDVLNYNRDENGNVSAKAQIYKRNKNGQEEQGEKLLTATGITLDMLSAFYYMRYVDYDAMKPGEVLKFNIFSGQKKEILRITYLEKTQINVPAYDNIPMDVYHVSFTFTYNDHDEKKSSDPIQAWIGVDGQRIPFMVTGRLPIGGIRCVLTSSEIY